MASLGWQSVWRRFLELAIKEEIMPKEDCFAQYDMKRRGSTDIGGTVSAGLDASGFSTSQFLRVYDKSIHLVPTSE